MRRCVVVLAEILPSELRISRRACRGSGEYNSFAVKHWLTQLWRLHEPPISPLFIQYVEETEEEILYMDVFFA